MARGEQTVCEAHCVSFIPAVLFIQILVTFILSCICHACGGHGTARSHHLGPILLVAACVNSHLQYRYFHSLFCSHFNALGLCGISIPIVVIDIMCVCVYACVRVGATVSWHSGWCCHFIRIGISSFNAPIAFLSFLARALLRCVAEWP
ncbi:hypothetical protein, unlikely [Trypanosoma congolense IL3000]|uniref:Uncharacterized protein n=1 Tax=Trypanosoma congolense (strain IL3000) TaxID=1068625 RepID=F9W6D0_TRYCI|nr:hypothetical protein, unlikely [Trypanosoma congolense IL3000]